MTATTKHLVVAWDTETDDIEIDRTGLSWFEVVGLLAVALDIAGERIPTPYYETEDLE